MSNNRRLDFLSEPRCLTPQPSGRFSHRNSLQIGTSGSANRLGAGSLLSPSYVSYGHMSPYVAGRRNTTYYNPNLLSSDVFYDHDYSYKHDMPNDRMLSNVKNDRFSVERKPRNSLNQSAIFPSYQDEQPRRAMTPALDRRRPSEIDTDDILSTSSMRDYEENNRGTRTPVPGIRGLSLGGGNDAERVVRPERSAREGPLPVVSEETEKIGKGGDKYCYECINASLAEKKRCQREHEKRKDKEMLEYVIASENKRGGMNQEREKMRNIIANKEAKEEKNQKTLERYREMYGRPVGPTDGGVLIHSFYERHDQKARERRAIEDDLKNTNLSLMAIHRDRRDFERLDRLTSEFNSLQISGNGYSNKRLESRGEVTRFLEDQIQEKQMRKALEKDASRKFIQGVVRENERLLARENQEKYDKKQANKDLILSQYNSATSAKEYQRERDQYEKGKARYYANQAYEGQIVQDRQQEQIKRAKQEGYRIGLQQQAQSGYKKRFDEKKQYYATGNSLKIENKKPDLAACNGCYKMKDTKHLNEMKI